MKRCALCVILILFPLLALAQNGPGRAPQPIQAVAGYLELSQEQTEAWLALLDGLRQQQRPLHEQIRAFEEELRLLLQQPEPEPAAVGRLVLQINALRDQLRLLEEEYRNGFEDLLTEAQLEKLFILRAASELAPLFPAFKETLLL